MQGHVKLIGDEQWHYSSPIDLLQLGASSGKDPTKKQLTIWEQNSLDSTHTLSLSQLLPAKMLPTKGHKEKNFHLQLHTPCVQVQVQMQTQPLFLSFLSL